MTQRTIAIVPNIIWITTLVLGLAACSSKDNLNVNTQVAAKVGSEEISVHQINQVLRNTGTTYASQQIIGREILETLIDQQLAVNQAIESKLNRSPQVVAELEAARRDVLARAYLQQIVGKPPKPSYEEIKNYYVEHPQLFAERRIFNLQEIIIPIAPGLAEQLRRAMTGGKTTEEISTWLKSKNIEFNSGNATRTAEQIPLEVLEKIHPLKDGQSTVLEAAKAITFLHIISSQQAPITEALAQPNIEKFLSNQRISKAMNAKLKELRANTQITYMGEFSKNQRALAEPLPSTNTSTTMEKGVAGLK